MGLGKAPSIMKAFKEMSPDDQKRFELEIELLQLNIDAHKDIKRVERRQSNIAILNIVFAITNIVIAILSVS